MTSATSATFNPSYRNRRNASRVPSGSPRSASSIFRARNDFRSRSSAGEHGAAGRLPDRVEGDRRPAGGEQRAPVQERPVRDRAQVARKASLAAVLVPFPPEGHERLLGQVLGVLGVTREPPREAVDRLAMGFEHRPELGLGVDLDDRVPVPGRFPDPGVRPVYAQDRPVNLQSHQQRQCGRPETLKDFGRVAGRLPPMDASRPAEPACAGTRPPEIEPEEAAEWLRAQTGVRVLDVRDPAERAVAKIEGSVLATPSALREVRDDWPRDAPTSSIATMDAGACSWPIGFWPMDLRGS